MSADESRQVQLLAFEGDWAVPSSDVLRVIEERDWAGGEACDAARVAKIAVAPDLTPTRVLVLSYTRGELPVKVRGSLALVEVLARELVQLPLEFRRAGFIATQVALQSGKPTLLVLDVARLAEAVSQELDDSAQPAPSKSSR
jgi:hypothetical protein